MNSHLSALLLTDAVALPATALLWVLREFEDKVDGGRRLAVITQASELVGNLNFETSSFDAIMFFSEEIGLSTVPWLIEISRLLKSGGIIVVHEPKSADTQTKTALERNLLLAGYGNLQTLGAWGELEYVTLSGNFPEYVTMKAQKPTWEIGSSFSIRTKTPEQQVLKLSSNEVCDPEMKENLVRLSTSFEESKLPKIEADDELIDEDSLLTEDDLKRPESSKVTDCEVGKARRKACKNCTCGRAEAEEKQEEGLTAEQLSNPRSACGSCGLGDAFRCGACPYKGLPPFNLGEMITLPPTLLAADV